MTFLDLREGILDTGLCTSCGLCVAACPERFIEIDVDHVVPVVVVAEEDAVERCGACSACLDVCPGADTNVATAERRIFGRTRGSAERWSGIVGDVYLASARDPRALAAASAGGAGTALLLAALRTGMIEAALVVGRSSGRPWVPEAKLATSEEEIIASAQASYCITPTLQLLRDAPHRDVGVVGLPCQIQAIEKLRSAQVQSSAGPAVALTIELGCSSNTPRAATEHLITERLGLPLERVASMRYRWGDYPGEFTVVDDAGGQHTLPFHELVLAFKSFKTFRCKACPDWWSGLADVSIADGDPNIFRTSRDGEPQQRRSLVVTRTARGARLVQAAMREGLLEIARASFDPGESLGLQRKVHRYRRMRGRYPDRVPTPPCEIDDDGAVLGDDEVIELLSASAGRR